MPIRSLLRLSRRIGPDSLNTTPLHPALCAGNVLSRKANLPCICSTCCIPVNPSMRRPQKEAGCRPGARDVTEVLRRYAGESVAETADDGIPVRIAPDVLEKMEERHILREDAVRVVRHAEASGDTFLNRDSGHFLASLRPVRVTFWVEYSVEDGVCVVHDAYCHRMEVPGTSTPKGRYEAVRNPFHL